MKASVVDQFVLPNQLGSITLYDWMADEVRDGRNLIRTDQSGREMWRAEPTHYGDRGTEDCFTKMDWDGHHLTAFTWTCYRVAIDIETGVVTTIGFTK